MKIKHVTAFQGKLIAISEDDIVYMLKSAGYPGGEFEEQFYWERMQFTDEYSEEDSKQ